MQPSTHERLEREETVTSGSDRAFGNVMAGACAIVAGLNWWYSGTVWSWFLTAAALFLVAAWTWPRALAPLNRLWFRFGLLLHHIINPLVMALIYYGTVVPTGLIMRALGKDPLRLRRDAATESYWIVRQPPGPAPQTMKDQF